MPPRYFICQFSHGIGEDAFLRPLTYRNSHFYSHLKERNQKANLCPRIPDTRFQKGEGWKEKRPDFPMIPGDLREMYANGDLRREDGRLSHLVDLIEGREGNLIPIYSRLIVKFWRWIQIRSDDQHQHHFARTSRLRKGGHQTYWRLRRDLAWIFNEFIKSVRKAIVLFLVKYLMN